MGDAWWLHGVCGGFMGDVDCGGLVGNTYLEWLIQGCGCLYSSGGYSVAYRGCGSLVGDVVA